MLHPWLQKQEDARFQRFRDECEIHSRLSLRPGILPVVGYAVPETPTRNNPAWLATEIAKKVEDELGRDAPLQKVVECLAAIAGALASLHAEGILHRDLKPNNLFSHNGAWVLGDFGLVDFPGKDSITASGEKLGPINFIAPEMLADAKHADGKKADVYSFGKTLYALTTGNTPPPGPQPLTSTSLLVSRFINHPKAFFLDRLIDNATKAHPADRPTMESVAVELNAWLAEPRQQSLAADMSGLIAQLAANIVPDRMVADQEAKRHAERMRLANNAARSVSEQLLDLAKVFHQAGGAPQVTDGRYIRAPFQKGQREGWAWEAYRGAILERTHPPTALLWSGFSLAIRQTDMDTLCFFAAYLLRAQEGPAWLLWSDDRLATAGSACEEQAIRELVDGLRGFLPEALRHFDALLKSGSTTLPENLPGNKQGGLVFESESR